MPEEREDADPQGAEAGYGVRLEMFEGPLDLLLFLIRKNELDIYDIPIAEITRQFLDYVEIIEELNLEQAGDFLLMAATLMKVKSRMLLPSDEEDDEEFDDPREELVRRLLEYQQYKEVASWLEEEQEANRDVYYRGAAMDWSAVNEAQDEEGPERTVGLFDLLAAFKLALAAAPKVDFHEVAPLEVTAEERAELICSVLSERGRATFMELVAGLPRIVLIVTFVALLELVKAGKAVARQADAESEIWIYARQPDEAPAAGPKESE
jgi:segregation and condensation protein A